MIRRCRPIASSFQHPTSNILSSFPAPLLRVVVMGALAAPTFPVCTMALRTASNLPIHILNTAPTGACAEGQQRSFQLFPSLPKELRLQIWEAAIPRERMIHVTLKPHEGRRYDLAAAEPRYLQRNALRKPISGERYRAVVEGTQLNSKFLSVNSEARKVALDFYRVHLPVYLTGPDYTERATLYFNPEHDFLHIVADAPVKETFIDFVWDLKQYDPRDVGLLKLAIDLEGFCANDLQYLKRSDLFLIRQRSALVETLSQLQEVWFINSQSQSSRKGIKYQTGIPATGSDSNWALPLRGGGPAFERTGPDQRHGLEQQLEQVYMGDIDPREILFRFRRLLRTWEVEHKSGQVQYRLVVARTPEWRRLTWQIAELGQAVDFLTRRDREGQESSRQEQREGLLGPKDKKAAAVGFWLFPLESIGEVREGEKLSDMDFQPGRVLDMRNHWPELVLSKIL